MRTLLAFWNHLKKSTNWIHSIPGVSNPPSTLIKKRGGAFRRVLLLSQGLGAVPHRADGAGNHCTTPASRPNTCLWDHLGADTAASLSLSSDRSLPAAAAGNSYTRAWIQQSRSPPRWEPLQRWPAPCCLSRRAVQSFLAALAQANRTCHRRTVHPSPRHVPPGQFPARC